MCIVSLHVAGLHALGAPTVAVVDIVETGSDDPDHLGVGLADLLEVELAMRGLAVYDRRSIRLVLGERALARGGALIESDKAFQAKLPTVRLLVTGNVRREPGDTFVLELTAVDVITATAVARGAGSGALPHGLVPALMRAAEQMVAMGLADNAAHATTPRAPSRFPGHLPSPETALFFYRAIEHYAAGRLEYAIAYFSQARTMDRAFTLAGLWELRGYQALGFPELAAALRDDRMFGRAEERKLAGLRLASGARPIVVVPAQVAGVPPAFLQGVREALGQDSRVSLFRSDWIPVLAAEKDLRLTGEFEHDVGPQSWLLADTVVQFRPQGDDATAPHVFHLHLIDAMSGKSLSVVRLSRAQFETDTDAKAAVHDLLAQRQPPQADAAAVDQKPPPTTDTRPGANPPYSRQDTQVVRFAKALRRLAETPDDPRVLCSINRGEPFTLGQQRWAAEHVITLIRQHPDTPDAAWLLATALRVRRGLQTPEPALADAYRELLERYPDSLPAVVIRYAQAHESLEDDPNADVTTTLEAVLAHLDIAVSPAESVWSSRKRYTDNLRINLYYFLALGHFKAGDRPKASLALNQAETLAKGAKSPPRPSIYGGMDVMMDGTFLMQSFKSTSKASRQRMNRDSWNDLTPDMLSLRQQLKESPVPVADGLPAPPSGSALELCEQAFRTHGGDALSLHIASLRQYVTDTLQAEPSNPGTAGLGQAESRLPTRVLCQVEWLFARMPDKEPLLTLVDGLLAKQASPATAFDLHLATGRYAEAVKALAPMLEAPQVDTRMDAIVRQTELLYYRGKAAELLAALDRELARFSTAFAKVDGTPSLGEASATLRLFSAAHYLALGYPVKARERLAPILAFARTGATGVMKVTAEGVRVYVTMPTHVRAAALLYQGLAFQAEGNVTEATASGKAFMDAVGEQTGNWVLPYVGRLPPLTLASGERWLRYLRAYGGVPVLFRFGSQQAATAFDAAGLLSPELVAVFRTLSRGDREWQWGEEAEAELQRRGRDLWPAATRPMVVLPPCYFHTVNALDELARNRQLQDTLVPPTAPVMPFVFSRSVELLTRGRLDAARPELAADLPWMLAAWVCEAGQPSPAQIRQRLDACALPPAEMQPLLVQMLASPEPLARQYAAHVLARSAAMEVSRDANGLPDENGVVSVKAIHH